MVGAPDCPPKNEILEQLKQLAEQLPDTTYRPDEDESGFELTRAVYIHGAILFTQWMFTGYGDDVQSTQRTLEKLLARLRASGFDRFGVVSYNLQSSYPKGEGGLPPFVKPDLVHSLSERVAAQFAFERGVYAEALNRIVNSVGALFETYGLDLEGGDWYQTKVVMFAPWLANHEAQAREYLKMCKDSNSQNIDWPSITQACARMSEYTLDYAVEPFHPDPRTGDSAFWAEQVGWARNQLTLPEILAVLEERADEAAANRLRIYFFPGNLWSLLPQRAQRALVSTDKQMVTGAELSRREGIFNELRIATEEVLLRCLWQPVSEWAKGQGADQSRLRATLAELNRKRSGPGLDAFVQLLYADGVKGYLRSIGVDDDGIQFLTKEKRTADYLRRLQHDRNTAEHEYNHIPGVTEIRALYAEALGIGRKGVLPELLRLLARRPEPARPDLGDLNL